MKEGDLIKFIYNNSVAVGFIYNTFPNLPNEGILMVAASFQKGGVSNIQLNDISQHTIKKMKL